MLPSLPRSTARIARRLGIGTLKWMEEQIDRAEDQ